MSNRSIGIIIIILVIVMGGVFAFMNREIVKGTRAACENAEIILKGGGLETKLTFDEIVQLGEKRIYSYFRF